MLGLTRPWEGPGPSPMDPDWGRVEIMEFPTPSQRERWGLPPSGVDAPLPHSGPPMTSPVSGQPVYVQQPPPTVFVPRVDPVIKWAAVGVGAIVLFFFIRGVTT